MEPLTECMGIFCSLPAHCKCPFCLVKFCGKHGTKTKWDAWPKEKFGNKTPHQYWPCAMCDRKIKHHHEFDNLTENEYNTILIEIVSMFTQEELENGIGRIKKPSKQARLHRTSPSEVALNEPMVNTVNNTNCEICNEEILWRKHSAMKIVTLGMLGAVIGAFAGPIGLTAGALIGGEAGLSKRPTICDRCLDENIGNCRSCGEGMTRRSHVSNGTGTCCWADDDQ